jgi:hypothetical protein
MPKNSSMLVEYVYLRQSCNRYQSKRSDRIGPASIILRFFDPTHIIKIDSRILLNPSCGITNGSIVLESDRIG